MAIHFGFAPDARRAQQLDRRMHVELGRSIEEVRCRAHGVVAFDDFALRDLVASLQRGCTVSPDVFGRYYDLVVSLLSGDWPQAEQIFNALAITRPQPAAMQVRALQPPGIAVWSDLYRRKMTEEDDAGVAFVSPSMLVLDAFRKRHAAAMALAEQALPALAAEVRALVREVVCVVGGPASTSEFQGGSHYQLWGALFLNAEYHDSRLKLLEVIAHESAHSLLFGFCIEDPLIYNADSERFLSPLRSDPRPMDGIYHATFVSARMHWTVAQLLESGLLSTEERDLAAAACIESSSAFRAGYEVVRQYARMSDFAAELMEGARSAMADVST